MKSKWKILIAVLVLAVIAGGIAGGIRYKNRGIVTVQTGKVARQDIASIVTASGEVKPRNYINIGAEYQGQLTAILVKEGDHVGKGQQLARIDQAQSAADVQAQQAAVNSAQADASATEAAYAAGNENITVLQSTLERTKADLDRVTSELDRTQVEFERGRKLFEGGLIPRQDYDQRKAAVDSQKAAVESQKAAVAEAGARIGQARAQLAQLRAQQSASHRRIAQSEAGLTRVSDILRKHLVVAPIDGLVTYLPVRVGETVVPGVQNSAASTIMTIADMSIVTAEVKVDETDIVNIKLNQPAEVTIDAVPGKTFAGHVIEIGNTAILRSTGLAASQSSTSSQEAKDFKVVVAIDNPPDTFRPGLSCAAKITTATRPGVLAIPIQALTTRTRGDLAPIEKGKKEDKTAIPDPAVVKANREEITGVFIITPDNKVDFRKVETGITGVTDIEILSGLKENEQIITGAYQVIRTIRNQTAVKIDNKPPAPKPAT